MRFYGPKETPQHPVIPDTVLSLQLTANSAQAFDYPENADLFRVSVGSSVAGLGSVFFNPSSTGAALGTTSGTIAVSSQSSGHNILVHTNSPKTFQRSRSSTGFSLVSASSVHVSIEFWTRGGSTS